MMVPDGKRVILTSTCIKAYRAVETLSATILDTPSFPQMLLSLSRGVSRDGSRTHARIHTRSRPRHDRELRKLGNNVDAPGFQSHKD